MPRVVAAGGDSELAGVVVTGSDLDGDCGAPQEGQSSEEQSKGLPPVLSCVR